MEKKGKLIIIEGGEGCGKTGHVKLLGEFFKEKKVLYHIFREPGGVKEAEWIRDILLNPESKLDPLTELFLFEAARSVIYEQTVSPMINSGVTLITDRSGFSTEAYQGYAGQVSLDTIKFCNSIATRGIKHDLAFIIDVPVKKGLAKEVNPDRFALKGLDFHNKVNEGYRRIAEENPESCVLIPYREGDIEGMQKEIREIVMNRFSDYLGLR